MRRQKMIMDFEQYKEVFLSTKDLRARTLKDYKTVFSKFHSTFATLDRDTLTYFAQIPQTSPAIYNKPYTCLSCYFNWLVSMDLIPYNPLTKLGLKKRKDEGNIKPASIEDIKKLLKACDKSQYTGYRNYTIILLMLDTGIRTSELLALQWEDWQGDSIIIRKAVSKTKQLRTIYLTPQTIACLTHLSRDKACEYIFSSRDCNQMDSNNLAREFRHLSERAGVKITPYQLRHSFFTFSLLDGMDLLTLQRIGGHSNLETTKRYVEFNQEYLQTEHTKHSPLNRLSSSRR